MDFFKSIGLFFLKRFVLKHPSLVSTKNTALYHGNTSTVKKIMCLYFSIQSAMPIVVYLFMMLMPNSATQNSTYFRKKFIIISCWTYIFGKLSFFSSNINCSIHLVWYCCCRSMNTAYKNAQWIFHWNLTDEQTTLCVHCCARKPKQIPI